MLQILLLTRVYRVLESSPCGKFSETTKKKSTVYSHMSTLRGGGGVKCTLVLYTFFFHICTKHKAFNVIFVIMIIHCTCTYL